MSISIKKFSTMCAHQLQIIGNDSNLVNSYIKTCLGDKYSECYRINIPIKYCEAIIKDMICKNEECVKKHN